MFYDLRAIDDDLAGELRQLVVADIGFPDPMTGKFDCPFHQTPGGALAPWFADDASLVVSGGRWRCEQCNAWGRSLGWLKRRLGISVADAARLLIPADDLRRYEIPPPRPTTPDAKRHARGRARWPKRRNKLAWVLERVGYARAEARREANSVLDACLASGQPERAWRNYLMDNRDVARHFGDRLPAESHAHA